ncbi:MAG: hypothetical protein ABI837_19870 [Acidobacteriota bacterium]
MNHPVMKAAAPLTIINTPEGNWSDWTHCFVECEIVNVAEFSVLASTLRALHEEGREVERVVIDGSMPAASCLEFLATLPRRFMGDILFIAREGRTFLSATGRGGDRILYMLEPRDVLFYLQVHSRRTAVSEQPHQPPRDYFAERASLTRMILPESAGDIDSSLYLGGGRIPMSALRPAVTIESFSRM